MRISNNISNLGTYKNVNQQRSINKDRQFQQKPSSCNPSFGTTLTGAAIALGIFAVLLGPVIWIDNQKWSGPTLDEIRKKDAEGINAKAKNLEKALAKNKKELKIALLPKFINKIMKKTRTKVK